MSLINLNFLGIIEAKGKDRHLFLNNLLSNDIKNLKINEACYATFNNAKGRVIANMLVITLIDSILIIMSKDLITNLIQKLNIYKFRNQIIINQDNNIHIYGLIPNKYYEYQEENVLKFNYQNKENDIEITLPHKGKIILKFDNDNNEKELSNHNKWKQYEFEHGYLWINAYTTEKYVAQMFNFQNTGAINFKKGCYPGQEVIARSQYLGQVKRSLVLLKGSYFENIQDGIDINNNNEKIGTIINHSLNNNIFYCLAIIKNNAINDNLFMHNEKLELVTIFNKE